MVKLGGSDLGNDPNIVRYSLGQQDKNMIEIADTDLIQLQEARDGTRDRLTAISYLQSAAKNIYGKLLEDLAN